MEKLTSNKKVSDMSMIELAHNACYIKDGVARYRDFETDIDARDLARELAWSLADIELSRNNECFDEEIIENLQYDITKEPIGLIALFYRNLWAMADLRERLKEYEDLEEQGLLLRLPAEAYFIKDNIVCKGWVQELVYSPCRKLLLDIRYDDSSLDSYRGYLGNNVFLTQAEAEQKLKEMESD